MAHSLIPKFWSDNKSGGDVFSSLHREIDRVFDQFHSNENWPLSALTSDNGKLAPRVNISETEKEIEVTAELPGVDEKEIDVSLTDDLLTIKGEKKSETEKTEKDFRVFECTYGSFERTMRLPCEVNNDKIDAKFKNGVLTITLPKSHSAKAKTKKIKVASK